MKSNFYNFEQFKFVLRIIGSVFFLGMLLSLFPQSAYADCGFDYRSPPFDYYPSLSPTSGPAPLSVEANWNENWSSSYDEENPDQWKPFPLYENFLYLDWGDGNIQKIPEERCPDPSITPGFGTKNWAAQILTHTYNNPGTYTVRLGFQSVGAISWSSRVSITVIEPEPTMNDSDGDGIPDEQDECPNEVGPVWNNGCPEPPVDSDNDGIPDDQDECPNEVGSVSNNGCPEPPVDSDNDGIPDDQDECPNEFGPPSNSGCPEPPTDSDNDGIPDDQDECPNEFGPFHNNGCPESNVKKFNIKFMAFIPANYVDTPFSPEAQCLINIPAPVPTVLSKPLIYAGDDRGFNPFASQHGQYRVMQKVTIVKEEYSDGSLEYYIESGSKKTRVNASHSYVKNGTGDGALDHGAIGRIDSSDNDGILHDCILQHDVASDTVRRIKKIRFTRLNKNKVKVHFKGKARNGLIRIGPSIDWDFSVIINSNKNRDVVRVRGNHDNFPAYEVYVNNKPVHLHTPLSLFPAQLPVVSVNPFDVLRGLNSKKRFNERTRLK